MGRSLFVFVAGCLLAVASPACADITFSLTSPDDLNHVSVGSTLTFEVRLFGIGPGQELDSAAATVLYNSAVLGFPTITAGDIVPNPLFDPLDFITSPADGLADATFITFGTNSADHIVSDGVLFSFQVEALAASGSLSFDFVDATQFNVDNPDVPITLPAIAGPAIQFVPEPESLFLLVIGSSTLWIFRRK